MSARRELRMDQLLGRNLLAANHRPVGRIEEFHARRQGTGWISTGVVVGMLGLLERLDVGARMLLGHKRRGYVVRWDQIDISDPEEPRLTVPVDELETSDQLYDGG